DVAADRHAAERWRRKRSRRIDPVRTCRAGDQREAVGWQEIEGRDPFASKFDPGVWNSRAGAPALGELAHRVADDRTRAAVRHQRTGLVLESELEPEHVEVLGLVG